MKLFLTAAVAAAITVPAAATAPATEAPAISIPKFSVHKASDFRDNTFFQGFEGRPEGFGDYYDEWLPEGWSDVTKADNTVPEPGEARHNLTWRVLDNDNRNNSVAIASRNYAFEGTCFAHIMPDQAYNDYVDLREQDEWLISPAFTPVTEDWLYFKLFYNAGWTVYNRTANDFTGLNNSLQVYLSEDDGTSWKRVWDLVDDEIRPNWTDEELRAELINVDRDTYTPIFVNIAEYVGKSVRLAFRYYGRSGHPMSIDNVAVGVPAPRAEYARPAGYMMQGLSPAVDYPKEPTLLAPYGMESLWLNYSENALKYEWTYTAADGSTVTSTDKNITTPAYDFGTTVATPSLTATFESRVSEPYTDNHVKIQYGGTLSGEGDEGYKGEFGIGTYDIADPKHSIMFDRRMYGFHPALNENWAMRFGVPEACVSVMGFINAYYASPMDWGFDYADVTAFVEDPLESDGMIILTAYACNDLGSPEFVIGQSYIKAADVPVSQRSYVNLRFEFPVPVYVPAGTDILTMLTFDGLEDDTILFPYVKTSSSSYGTTYLYWWQYDDLTGWVENLGFLGQIGDGTEHFAGMLQTIGATYAPMTLLSGDTAIDAPMEGTTAEYKVRTPVAADHIKVTEYGLHPAENVECEVTADEADPEVKTVKVTVLPAKYSDDRESTLYIVAPGARVELSLTQPGDPEKPAGLDDITAAGSATVKVVDGNIEIRSASAATASLHSISGMTVATATVTDGSATIAASHLPKGVYVVSVGDTNVKIVK